jgi:hypothetical protein
MNRKLTQPLLLAALLVLLSAVLMPGTHNGVLAKGAYPTDAVAVLSEPPPNDLGTTDGDAEKISGKPGQWITLPPQRYITPSPNPAPAPDVAFTTNQARAPPVISFF